MLARPGWFRCKCFWWSRNFNGAGRQNRVLSVADGIRGEQLHDDELTGSYLDRDSRLSDFARVAINRGNSRGTAPSIRCGACASLGGNRCACAGCGALVVSSQRHGRTTRFALVAKGLSRGRHSSLRDSTNHAGTCSACRLNRRRSTDTGERAYRVVLRIPGRVDGPVCSSKDSFRSGILVRHPTDHLNWEPLWARRL